MNRLTSYHAFSRPATTISGTRFGNEQNFKPVPIDEMLWKSLTVFMQNKTGKQSAPIRLPGQLQTGPSKRAEIEPDTYAGQNIFKVSEYWIGSETGATSFYYVSQDKPEIIAVLSKKAYVIGGSSHGSSWDVRQARQGEDTQYTNEIITRFLAAQSA